MNNLKNKYTHEQEIMTEKELRRFGLAAKMLFMITQNPDVVEVAQKENKLAVALNKFHNDHIDFYGLYQASCHTTLFDNSLFCDAEELKGFYYQEYMKECNKNVPYSIMDLEILVKEYNEKGQKCGIKHIYIDIEKKQANLAFGWQQKGARNLFHLFSYGPMCKSFDIIFGLCMIYHFNVEWI